jgi:Cof subfamily protein (haloacid dehalogenase superfamily)
MAPPDAPSPRLVASDLDGTLLRTDKTISDRTVAAVAACEAGGITVVLATGRPPRWLADVSERLGHRGVALCANGAVTYDLDREQVLAHATFADDASLEIVGRVRRLWPSACFAVETLDHLGLEPAWPVTFPLPQGTHIAEAAELLTFPPVKILAWLEGHPAETALVAASAQLAGLAEVTWSGASHLLEMSAPGVTKEAALAQLAGSLGIAAGAAVAFGDMPNDIGMLRWAGRGLAVANAHQLVLAAADAVVGSNDDDGVAVELESILG